MKEAAAVLAERAGTAPRVAVVLGSGLGAVADAVEDAVVVGYDELPGFPRPSVAGHAGRAVLGRVGGVQVAVLQGRAHLYEGGDPEALRTPVRALREAGAEILVLTNAAGSLRAEVGPGSLMAITAVAVVAERLEHCPPCGGCRQRLAEFGGPRTPVYLGRPGATPQTFTLAELLPESFDRGALDA